MKADGSGVKQLTNDGPNTRPAWSHDGSAITHVSGNNNLFIMSIDGSNPHS